MNRRARKIERRRAASLQAFNDTAERIGLRVMSLTNEDDDEIRSYEKLQHQINAKEGVV